MITWKFFAQLSISASEIAHKFQIDISQIFYRPCELGHVMSSNLLSHLYLESDQFLSVFDKWNWLDLKTAHYKGQTPVQWGGGVVPQLWTFSSRSYSEIFQNKCNYNLKGGIKDHQNSEIPNIKVTSSITPPHTQFTFNP